MSRIQVRRAARHALRVPCLAGGAAAVGRGLATADAG